MSGPLTNALEAVRFGTYDQMGFGPGLCGPESVFVRSLRAAVGADDKKAQEARSDLNAGLKGSEPKFSTPPGNDSSVSSRWKALAAFARAVLDGRTGPNEVDHSHFEGTHSACGVDPNPKLASAAVRDCLAQLKGEPPVPAERAWVLFADGRDFYDAVQLVVELVRDPGAGGTVIPNWWKLGLCPFNTTVSKDAQFVTATQEALRWVASAHRDYRLRWHLEKATGVLPIHGLEGRSGTAAAVIAAIAVFQRLHNNLPAHEQLLDLNTAITAEAQIGDPNCCQTWTLDAVDELSLGGKFAAAIQEKIDTVLLAKRQPGTENVTPKGLCTVECATVGAAFELMRSSEGLFDAYRTERRAEFEYYPPPGHPDTRSS